MQQPRSPSANMSHRGAVPVPRPSPPHATLPGPPPHYMMSDRMPQQWTDMSGSAQRPGPPPHHSMVSGPPPHHVMSNIIPQQWLQQLADVMPPTWFGFLQARWQANNTGMPPEPAQGSAQDIRPQGSSVRHVQSGGCLTAAAPWPEEQSVPSPRESLSSATPRAEQQSQPASAVPSATDTVPEPSMPNASHTQQQVPPLDATVSTAAAPAPQAGEINLNPLQFSVSPLSQSVPLNLKQKIWAHEFIELSALLKQEQKQHMRVEFNSEGQLVCTQPELKNKINSIEKWSTAFISFMFIYLEKFSVSHPSKSLELLQYMESIRYAAATFPGLGWLTYDEQVRRGWQNPNQCFSAMNGEYWLRYVASGARATVAATPKSSSKFPCFDFNKGHCAREKCSFAHKCRSCGAYGHGAFQSQLCGKSAGKPKNGASRAVGEGTSRNSSQPFRPYPRPGEHSTQGRQAGGATH